MTSGIVPDIVTGNLILSDFIRYTYISLSLCICAVV